MTAKKSSHKRRSRTRDMTAVLRTMATQTEADQIDPRRQQNSNRVMRQFGTVVVAKGVSGLMAEYNTITKLDTHEPASAYEKHPDKNRFRNVKCYDKSRVVLKYLPKEGDYIHANRVRSNFCDNMPLKFICTQGPMESTVNDFWRMIWQEQPEHIVMLCKTVENNVPKCAEYCPLINETKTYGTIMVQSVRDVTKPKETAFESVQLNYSIVSDAANTKVLTIHRWKDWPDFGVPVTGMSMLRLLKILRADVDCTVVVHCSAGIGRTGTLVTTAFAFQILFEGKELKMPELLRELRLQRDGLIQKDCQYVFVHRALAEYIQTKLNDQTLFKSFFDGYKRYLKTQTPLTPSSASKPSSSGV